VQQTEREERVDGKSHSDAGHNLVVEARRYKQARRGNRVQRALRLSGITHQSLVVSPCGTIDARSR
jgi:hypothetical protein